ncbi:30S ribosomal protein S1 [Phenylobacterium sp.]|uniref:30S ribosomal protein S1 n=1 Tax=Phenylobacterium sp. TaxID=1871053 RepID=UPI002733BB78|nr:30S ribosomal protein S1 [Phenylobacterium sp.]MDP3852731.1 30S ribosomal protein S1 [Phenylobacterium sp.]
MSTATTEATGMESFAALFEESLSRQDMRSGEVISAEVVRLDHNFVIVNAGLKSEAFIPIEEFKNDQGELEVQVGDFVSVAIESLENGFGDTILSRDKAKRLASWLALEKAMESGEIVIGTVNGKVKGGLTVLTNGIRAFLPGSLVDTRPVKDTTPFEGKTLEFKVIKLDRKRNNVVLSRRAVIEASMGEERQKLMETLKEGTVVTGVVKNITDYGAFVDLGGIDGLLHVTDMSWKRVNHPSQVLAVGDTVKVQIVKINPDTQRISLGMKQLQSDPWDGVEAKYPVGAKFTGRITNITDYGAFVELEAGVEGLVHVSEMSWTKKNVHPGKIVSTSQEVDVVVLDVDPSKRRVSLGLKQAMANPWDAFVATHPVGSTVEGEVKNATEFGLFIGLDNDIDGMVHLSDLDWTVSGEEAIAKYNKGDIVKARVLDVDVEKERISLGIKQLAGDPMQGDNYRTKQTVTVTVTEITTGGIEVKFGDDEAPMTAFIRKSDLSRDRADQRPERFAVGDRVDAQISSIDKAARRVSLSIKALEMVEEKEAIEKFGSSDSGASLGDILGAALREKATGGKE